MSATTNIDVLLDAVARNAAIVLSLPSAGMLRHHKSRFLSQVNDGLWIEGAPEDRVLVEELVATGTKAGVSFKTGTRMVSFSATVIRREPQFVLNANTQVEALLIEAPKTIDSVQRRLAYRVKIPTGSDEIKTRVWRIPEHHYLPDKVQPSLEMPHQLMDISAGGMGVTLFPKGSEPIKGSKDERLRIEVEYQQEQILIEGRLRLPNQVDRVRKCRAGIAFKKLESNLEGRRALALLNKIVGDLQRDEIRRHRLGMREAS